MKPTDILSNEHRVIEQVLDCLEEMVGESDSEGKLDKQPAKDAVAFFRNFADRCHHMKEETHLFRAMESRGFPREGGPTGVMLHEHELARAHVRAMDEAIEAASAGDAVALGEFSQQARGYIELLRQHIDKEDHCLYAMANQALTEGDQRDLLDAFQKVENDEIGPVTHETYLKIANDLADRFGVSRRATSGAGESGCAGHPGHGCGDQPEKPGLTVDWQIPTKG